MSTLVANLETQHAQAVGKADHIISAAERARRPLTPAENSTVNASIAEANTLKQQIDTIKNVKVQRSQSPSLPEYDTDAKGTRLMPSKLTAGYQEAFPKFLSSGQMNASMQEGVGSAGGQAVPITVDGEVVPLAPTDSAVRRLATVVPTKSDIKTPQITARGIVAAKAEGSSFTVAVPTFGQFLLSAFAAGVETQASLELVEDAALFQAFITDDAVSAFLEYEESLFISGTGSGQAQGLIGNVGAGVTEEPDANSNLVTVNGTLNLLGQLKDRYHLGASFLMQRSTSLILRKAQVQSTGVFEPIFTRENGQDFIHGYPCEYSSAMPSAIRGNAPILFGQFRSGYIIGDRGGSALLVKVLNQAGAAQGLIDLLFFRRTDGRVRRSEAIQQYNIAAS